MKKTLFISLFTAFLFVLYFLFKSYQEKENGKLYKDITVQFLTQQSICETNADYPIELKIINNTNKNIRNVHIKYSVAEQDKLMHADFATFEFSTNLLIEKNKSFSKCIKTPIKKLVYTLTKEDMKNDGEVIKKSYPNAKVGFNIYKTNYLISADTKEFEFE